MLAAPRPEQSRGSKRTASLEMRPESHPVREDVSADRRDRLRPRLRAPYDFVTASESLMKYSRLLTSPRSPAPEVVPSSE